MNDRNIRVRRNVLICGLIGDKEVLVPLIVVRKDEDHQIRENAEEAYQKIVKRIEETDL